MDTHAHTHTHSHTHTHQYFPGDVDGHKQTEEQGDVPVEEDFVADQVLVDGAHSTDQAAENRPQGNQASLPSQFICNVVQYVLFHCPEYDTCRQECPDLILGNMSIKNISDFNNQETIAKLLWNIIMIRIWFRPRNPPGLIKAVKSLSHCAGTPNITPRGRHLTPRQHTTRPGEV